MLIFKGVYAAGMSVQLAVAMPAGRLTRAAPAWEAQRLAGA